MVRALITILFGVTMLLAVYSVPVLGVTALTGRSGGLAASAGLVMAIAAVALWWSNRTTPRLLEAARSRVGPILSDKRTLILIVLAGIALRAGWALYFPAPLRSDPATYFELAAKLYHHGAYQDGRGDYAYWPPGYPFFLYGTFLLLGDHRWVPPLANLVLYVAMAAATWRLALLAGGRYAAGLALLILSIWPNAVFSTSIASKELWLATLLSVALAFYVSSSVHRGWYSLAYASLAGLALGFGCLTQPSLLMLPVVFMLYEYLRRSPPRAAVGRIALLLLGTALIVSPWTTRNYARLGAVVPVSSNGGEVFYRANNSMATGAYLDPDQVGSLFGYDEVTRNRIGYRLGMDWATSHPLQFVRLALRKIVLFLGDDSTGAFETLKRGQQENSVPYLVSKGISTGYWLLLWLILGIGLVERRNSLRHPVSLLLGASVLYFLAIHSVFESGGRYHMQLLAVVAVLTALAAAPRGNGPPLVPTSPDR